MPYYDIKKMKELLDIVDIVRKDGHILKKSGSNYLCLCPFHDERTPSFCINSKTQSFRCFGCDCGGDIIKYWERTRGCDFKTALEQLDQLTGTTCKQNSFRPNTHKQKLPNRANSQPIALSHNEQKKWYLATQNLLENPEWIAQIAKWRGFSPNILRWAAMQQLIGITEYFNQTRVAFLVKAPIDKTLKPVSSHLLLMPRSKGNDSEKKSWRYAPSGMGSWPFIITASPQQVTHVFITEGQWDTLALLDVMKWHTTPSVLDQICLLGMRGAFSKCASVFKELSYNLNITIIIFIDSDEAGRSILSHGGIVDRLRALGFTHIFTFSPSIEKSDLNARLVDGINHTHLLNDTAIQQPKEITLNQLLPFQFTQHLDSSRS